MHFSVTDTGIGISPDDLQKLFKPFVQVDGKLSRQYEGTGLGLALVKKMVDLHHGSIEVQSEIGVGSRFALLFPGSNKLSPAVLFAGIFPQFAHSLERRAAFGVEKSFLSKTVDLLLGQDSPI